MPVVFNNGFGNTMYDVRCVMYDVLTADSNACFRIVSLAN